MSMQKNTDYKFDVDLERGQLAEDKLIHILGNCKVEVKNDYFIDKTGNIAIEYECWGKPSGLSTTQADWYFIFVANTDCELALMIQVDRLKRLARTFYQKGSIKQGGEENTSKFILIPWQEILKLDNYGQK